VSACVRSSNHERDRSLRGGVDFPGESVIRSNRQ
jgi:hypothetical protein